MPFSGGMARYHYHCHRRQVGYAVKVGDIPKATPTSELHIVLIFAHVFAVYVVAGSPSNTEPSK